MVPPMKQEIPTIIQGGMGAGVSNWRLARAVSWLGQLGVVAGTALDQILSRRLQDGDQNGHIRRALEHFPFPQITRRILDAYFIPGGRDPAEPYHTPKMKTVEGSLPAQELCIAANFVEVFLAREGHTGPVGINFLEKIQMPHLPSLYGAMLAGAAVIIVGAGIPMEFPAAIEALSEHQSAAYTLTVADAQSKDPVRKTFNPRDFFEPGQTLASLPQPGFLPIVSSDTLATMLVRRIKGSMAGFIVEGPVAGGHNAPPRGQMQLSAENEPIYGKRDVIKPEAFRKLGLPFWLAGAYGSHERLTEAREAGAAGIQVGTPFALCKESGVAPDLRRALLQNLQDGKARVFTDAKASPTGFPFKVAELDGTLSEQRVYEQRRRICDLGFLREVYQKPDGSMGTRCAAEPERAYIAKGGKAEACAGRKCLCNALLANIGMPQQLADGTQELPLLTLGDDYADLTRFCENGNLDFSAADVIRQILG